MFQTEFKVSQEQRRPGILGLHGGSQGGQWPRAAVGGGRGTG